MFCAYAVAVSAAAHLSPRLVIGAIVALNVLVLLGPPLISTDVFSYQAYARMGAIYGINPYLHGPYAINLDHVFPYVGAKWSNTPNAYGPLFTVFSYAFAKLSIATSVYVYKAIAGAAALGLVAVVWRCAGQLRTNQVRAVALVGLNPLLIVYGVGGGHNDLLMLLAVTGALYALVCGRERLGGTLGVVAAGIKLTGGLMLPFAIAAEGPHRGHRRRRDLLLAIAASIAAIAALNFAVFGSGGFHLLGTLSQGQKEGSWNSIPGFIPAKLGLHDDQPRRRPTCWRPRSSRSAVGCCGASGADRWTGSPPPAGRRWRCCSPPVRCFPGTWRGCCRWPRSAATGVWCRCRSR